MGLTRQNTSLKYERTPINKYGNHGQILHEDKVE